MKKHAVGYIITIFFYVDLTGCSSLTPPLPPEKIPEHYVAPLSDNATDMPVAEWWENFSSDELTDDIREAEKGNLDLAVYDARIKQARASTGAAAADLFPSIELDASGARYGQKPNADHSYVGTYNSLKSLLSMSYNLDLWGEERDKWRNAKYSALAAIYGREVKWLSVSSSVADTYFSILSYRERIAVARRNLEAANRVLKVTRLRVSRGAESRLGLAQQTAIVKSEEVIIPSLEEKEREATYKLAILLGRPPEKIEIAAQSVEGITMPTVSPGLPSDLLRHRPDIAVAEANLKAAHANLSAARAAFLPSISLTASGGYSSMALSRLLDPDNLVWSLAASLAQTIFDGGKLTSQRDYYQGVETELIATYRNTVFNALSDVETALGSIVSLSEQVKIETEHVDNAAEAFRIAELQYRGGVLPIQTVIDTQQTLFNADDELVEIKLSRIEAAIDLYVVLGGGWSVKASEELPTRNVFVPVPLPVDLDKKTSSQER